MYSQLRVLAEFIFGSRGVHNQIKISTTASDLTAVGVSIVITSFYWLVKQYVLSGRTLMQSLLIMNHLFRTCSDS